jgi:uncharacterized repeat protein (TIGR01451 family)
LPKRSVRSATARIAAVVVLVLGLVPAGLAVGVPTASAATTPAPNPLVPEQCGINVTLILDASGSVSQAHAVENVRDSARAFLEALADTNSTARVIDFGTVARVSAARAIVTTASLEDGGAFAGALDAYYNPKPPFPNGVSGHQFKGGDRDPLAESSYTGGHDTQYTNWDQALHLAREDATDLIVFVTDGEPSAMDADQPGDPFFGSGTPPPDVLYGLSSGAGLDLALDRAVQEANANKALGSRMLAIGVGNAFGSGSSAAAARARLVAVSGPQVVTDADDITDLNEVDVALVAEFDELQDVLRKVVTQLCSPSLTIRKLSQTAGDSFYEPTAGWDITVSPVVGTGNVPPFTWVQPAGAPVGPATLATDANGFVNFQWDPIPPSSTSVATVTEEDTATTTPLDWACSVKFPDGTVVESGGALDPVTPTFDVTVGPENIVTCTIRNSFDYAPGIDVIKTNTPSRIRGDGAGTPVTSTYVVTNTGNTPIDPIDGVDDKCAPLVFQGGDTNADGRLDVTETWTYTCVRIGRSAIRDTPLVVPNTIDVTGAAPDNTIVTATDTDDVTILVPNIFIEKTATPTSLVGSGAVDYTFEVTTTGNMPLDDVTPVDDQCSPLVFQTGDTSADGLLDNGETWIYTCTATVTEPTVDTVVVTGQPIDNGAALGGTVTASDTAEVDVLDPRMNLTKTADPTVVLQGQPVTYTFELSNDSVDATVLVPIAPATRDDAVTDGNCSPVTYASGDAGDDSRLEPGETWTYTCTTSYPTVGFVPNAAVAAMEIEGDGTDLTARAFELIRVIGADVDLTKVASRGVIHSGDSVTYTYEATNPGQVPLQGVTVVDDRCAPVTLASGDDGDDLLEPGELWVYTCTTTLTKPGGSAPPQLTVTNVATITGTPTLNGVTGNPVTDDATADVLVIQPELEITKVAAPTDVRLGGSVTYTVTVTNTGDSALFLALLRDDTCQPLEYQSGNTGGQLISSPGEAWVFTCTMTPTGDTTNSVGIFGIDRLGRILNRQDTADVAVFDPSIELVKTVSDDLVPTDSTVTYTYTATNTGDDPLTNITLLDPKCTNRVLVSSGNGDAIMDPAEVWTWTCDEAISATTTNTAVVGGLDHLGGLVADIDQATVTPYDAGVAITKSASPTQLIGSGEVTYTYEVTNTGNVPLADVKTRVVDDTCPTVAYVSGDDDLNDLLTGEGDLFETGPPETWVFTCTVTVTQDTTNVVVVDGTPVQPIDIADGTNDVLGADVSDDATAFVDVLDPATITITKDLVGGTNATFHFDGDLGPIALPVLDTTASQSVPNLGPGTYSVAELATDGWDFTSLACQDESGGTTVSGSTATIDLAEGETVTCTFTNTKVLPPPTDSILPLPPEIQGIVDSTPVWPLLLLVGGLGALAALYRRRRTGVGVVETILQAHPAGPRPPDRTP